MTAAALCRYISRPAVSDKRLALTATGQVRYQLKTPYRDGTTHVIFEPLDFIARLAALVPKPRVNLTRFHGVFAPASQTPCAGDAGEAGEGQQTQRMRGGARENAERTPGIDELGAALETGGHAVLPCTAPVQAAYGCANRRSCRFVNIDVDTCRACGGAVRIIACIEDPLVIEKILAHLDKQDAPTELSRLPETRAPPQADLFD